MEYKHIVSEHTTNVFSIKVLNIWNKGSFYNLFQSSLSNTLHLPHLQLQLANVLLLILHVAVCKYICSGIDFSILVDLILA